MMPEVQGNCMAGNCARARCKYVEFCNASPGGYLMENLVLRAFLSSWLGQIISAIIQAWRRACHDLIRQGKQPGYTRVAQTILDETATLLACHKAAIAKAPQMV